MTRLLVPLSPDELEALDQLMADRGDFVAGVVRQRARAIGPLLLRNVELVDDNERLREELERMRQGEQALHTDLVRERQARREIEAGRDRTLKALRAERDGHARTRQRLHDARAAITRLRASRDAMRRGVSSVAAGD